MGGEDYRFEDLRTMLGDHVNSGFSHLLGLKVMKSDWLQYTGKHVRREGWKNLSEENVNEYLTVLFKHEILLVFVIHLYS